MKDKNGIEICCENCRHYEYCDDKFFPDVAKGGDSCNFETSKEAYEARIAELSAASLQKQYLRIGEIPLDGKSKIHSRVDNSIIGEELGVSVFEYIEGKGIIIPNNQEARDDFLMLINSPQKPQYIVQGEEVGIGSDGEPLLKNVKIIKTLKEANTETIKDNKKSSKSSYLKNALPLGKRTCFNCRLANVISEDLGEVYCKRFGDSPQGIYRNAIIKMDKKGKCRWWEYKEENKK